MRRREKKIITWIALHPRMTPEHLGYLPLMLDENDPQPAAKQFHKHYRHGGGWDPFKGHTLGADNSLHYPGDPPLHPIASCQLRDELILLYEFSWVCIVQPDRSFEVCRMD